MCIFSHSNRHAIKLAVLIISKLSGIEDIHIVGPPSLPSIHRSLHLTQLKLSACEAGAAHCTTHQALATTKLHSLCRNLTASGTSYKWNHTRIALFLFLKNYLFDRQSKRKGEGQERESFHLLVISPVAAMAEAGPGQSQESRTPN